MADPVAQEDDLLAPSLTAHDDAVGFDRPWSPNYLVLVGAFFGLVPMGILMAMNERRLGRPGSYLPVLVGTLAGGLALTALASYAYAYGLPGLYEAGNKEHRRGFRLATQGVAIAVGLALAHRQRRRWEIHQGHGGESAPLLKAALGAIVLAFAIQFVVAAPFVIDARGGLAP